MGGLHLRRISAGRFLQSCMSGRASFLLIPLLIYALARCVNAVMILAVADAQHITYGDLVTAWDGDRYRQIALHGYPPALPIDGNGQVTQNVWAFSPLYPLLVRALMAVSGLDFNILAPTLSLLAGAAAAVVMFALISQTAGRVVGGATVALTCTFMSAPVMQIAYTESMALLLVCSALLFLRRHAYLLTAVTILLLSITRPISLAFLPVVLAHGSSVALAHGRSLRQARELATSPKSSSVHNRRSIWGLATACVVGAALWPVVVAITTGDPLGWVKSEAAWVTTPTTIPGLTWLRLFQDGLGWVGLAGLGIVAALVVMTLTRPAAAPWGVEVRAWTLSYVAYMFLATAPVPSVIRFTLLAFPLFWPFPSAASSARGRLLRIALFVTLAVVGVFSQWVWISDFVGAVGPSKLYP